VGAQQLTNQERSNRRAFLLGNCYTGSMSELTKTAIAATLHCLLGCSIEEIAGGQALTRHGYHH